MEIREKEIPKKYQQLAEDMIRDLNWSVIMASFKLFGWIIQGETPTRFDLEEVCRWLFAEVVSVEGSATATSGRFSVRRSIISPDDGGGEEFSLLFVPISVDSETIYV